MAIEIATWGMGRLAFLTYRAAVIAGLVASGLVITAMVVRKSAIGDPLDEAHGIRCSIMDHLIQLRASWLGYLELPFQPFVEVITADAITARSMAAVAVALAMVPGLAVGVIGLYAVMVRAVAEREQRSYSSAVLFQAAISPPKDGGLPRQPPADAITAPAALVGRSGAAGLAAIGRRPPSLGKPADCDDRPSGAGRLALLFDCRRQNGAGGDGRHAGVLHVPAPANRPAV